MKQHCTPIEIIETYFDEPLEQSSLKRFDELTEDQWIDFAKHYLARMQDGFAKTFLTPRGPGEDSIRFYFEPRITRRWNAAVEARYEATPLFGTSPHPPGGEVTPQVVSRYLDPLKKHLLLADCVYFRDNFYYCFDAVADSVDRARWRSDPNTRDLVARSIRSLKGWLPILVHLRGLIESRALVFMPYYITPSFPYGSTAPKLEEAFGRLRTRKRLPTNLRFNWDETLTAWLNARLLDLDAVFPDVEMMNVAAGLYFEEDATPVDVTSDPIPIEMMPFGGAEKGIEIDDLLSIRKNDEVFNEVQRVVSECKKHLERTLDVSSTPEAITAVCRTFLQDRLAAHESKSVMKFVKIAEKPGPGVVISIAIGGALAVAVPPSAPFVISALSIIGGAVFTPTMLGVVHRSTNATQRAHAHLQALL